jgi:arylsulfatase A-like enzyme
VSDQADRTVLPIRRPPFKSVANQPFGGSQPDRGLIGYVKLPARAPDVLLVSVDDADFGNPGTFGGPIATPDSDWIAAQGLRYDRFGVTAMWPPKRAGLLAGAAITRWACGASRSSRAASRAIRPGCRGTTAGIGKWHLTPGPEQGPAGPCDQANVRQVHAACGISA